MSYKELQKRAKELGMKKVVGVSAEELEQFIKKASKETKPSPERESPKEEPKRTEKVDKPKGKNPDAVVYDGKHRVRVYTLEQHGKDYVKLAEQFASHPDREGFRVEMETVETRITCPHCGKKFRQD